MSRALIVVDVQNDFCEGGSLAVEGGSQVARDVNELVRRWAAGGPEAPPYTHVVATKDHHIDPGSHWAPAGTEPDFRTSWPVHCKVGTPGEEFHPDLDPEPFEAIFRKGEYVAAYSGFEGQDPDGTALADWLRARGIEEVDVCGLATDHCVRATVLDARQEGFRVRVLQDLSAGVAPQTTAAALSEMSEAGAALA